MKTQTAIFLPFLTSLLFRIIQGTIMCSTCNSDTKMDCENNPPPPQPCTESGSGVTESCSTIQVFKTGTNNAQKFIRSCSSSESAGCFDSAPGYRTCALICYTDGCNSAWTLHVHEVSWACLLVLVIATIKMF